MNKQSAASGLQHFTFSVYFYFAVPINFNFNLVTFALYL
jgi:hypothetical protein